MLLHSKVPDEIYNKYRREVELLHPQYTLDQKIEWANYSARCEHNRSRFRLVKKSSKYARVNSHNIAIWVWRIAILVALVYIRGC